MPRIVEAREMGRLVLSDLALFYSKLVIHRKIHEK